MANIVDWDNGGVFQFGDDLGLTLEALAQTCIRESFAPKDLQRHFAVKIRIISTIHLGHPPCAEYLADLITTEFPVNHVCEYNQRQNFKQYISITEILKKL